MTTSLGAGDDVATLRKDSAELYLLEFAEQFPPPKDINVVSMSPVRTNAPVEDAAGAGMPEAAKLQAMSEQEKKLMGAVASAGE